MRRRLKVAIEYCGATIRVSTDGDAALLRTVLQAVKAVA
jgi:hypothetical protein